ncbi:MAG: phosphopantetheine-binding protein [Myxococcota bacterium]
MNIDDIRIFIQREILNDEAISIADDQDLLLSGLLDSLGVTRLVTHLEEQTGIEIPAGDVTLENFSSLALIRDYLQTRAA